MRKVKTYAFKLLAKKDYFENELKNKLLQKGFSEEEVKSVIYYLKEEGYLNDEKLIHRYKELAIEKGKSPSYLRKKLYQKGVYNIEFSYEEELQSAIHLLKFKYKKGKNYSDIVKFLKNRGFSYSVIQEAANKYINGEI